MDHRPSRHSRSAEAGIRPFTPEYAAEETGSQRRRSSKLPRLWRRRDAFSTHAGVRRRGTSLGWQITRNPLPACRPHGAIGEPGGENLHATNKFVPKHPNPPPAPITGTSCSSEESRLLLRDELPLAALSEGRRGRLDTYFTRVYNPLWTTRRLHVDGSPAGRVEIGMHVALTPIGARPPVR